MSKDEDQPPAFSMDELGASLPGVPGTFPFLSCPLPRVFSLLGPFFWFVLLPFRPPKVFFLHFLEDLCMRMHFRLGNVSWCLSMDVNDSSLMRRKCTSHEYPAFGFSSLCHNVADAFYLTENGNPTSVNHNTVSFHLVSLLAMLKK